MPFMKDLQFCMTHLNSHSMRIGRGMYPCVKSRGRELKGFDKNQELICGGMEWEWSGTKKDMVAFLKEHPETVELWVECGYDGAATVRDLIDYNEYEPWVSCWGVVVWNKENGFHVGTGGQEL